MRQLTHTWRLWAALKSPPNTHPLYRRAVAQQTRPIVSGWAVGAVVAYYLLLSLLLHGTQPASTPGDNIALTALLLAPLGLLIFGFSGSAYGITWTLRVCDALQKTRANGLYDLVAASPLGKAGCAWTVATGALHRGNTLARIPAAELPFTQGGARATLALILMLLLVPQGRATLFSLGIVAVVVLFAYTDYVQSGCIALLVGLWTAERTHGHQDARWGALAAFAAVQLATYGLLLLIVGVGFPRMGLNPLGMMGLPQLGVFYLIREPIIGRLWSHLNSLFLPENLVTPDAPTPDASALA